MRRLLALLGLAAAVAAAPASTQPVANTVLPAGNLIRNPGAEEGPGGTSFSSVNPPPGWETTSNLTVVAYTTPESPAVPPGGGNNYFAGGPGNGLSTATQDISLAQYAADIDRGDVQAALRGDLGGFSGQEDNATVQASFIDRGQEIGRVRIGPVTASERQNRSSLLTRSATATVPRGTDVVRVVLTATRASGDYNDGYFDNLSLTLSGGSSGGGEGVGTSFDGGTTLPSIDLGRPPEPNRTTVETSHTSEATQLTVGVEGNGVVTLVGSAGGLAVSAARISCGLNQFLCYARLEPGQRVTLRARPSPGFAFRAWTGACAGQGATCTVSPVALRTVSAVFVPSAGGGGARLALRTPRFSVRWNRSVGTGALSVRGSVGGVARLLVQLRRPGGGPLLGKVLRARGGFRTTMSLRQSRLPFGARLFPGGFVVSVTGTSEGFRLPLQLRTIVLTAPPEGVVRQVFASATRDGASALRLPARSTQAWAHFRFATQPLSRLPVTVTWYLPNGRRLGTVTRANQPEVVSGIGFGPGLQSGRWVVELRAGGRVAQRLSFRIG